MSVKGIIFSAPMVRALLDGRKTQTRRLCAWANNPNSPQLTYIVACDEPGWFGDEEGEVQFRTFCAPGDRLYVREAWATVNSESGPGWAYRSDGSFLQPTFDGKDYGAGPSFNYEKYPGSYTMWYSDLLAGSPGHQWTPSIHQPRWASRLWLAVTDVRVQRLQDCSEADAIAEGLEREGDGWKAYETLPDGTPHPHAAVPNRSPITSYAELWDSLHTKAGERWEDNPWVVAVTFDVHRGNIDQVPA